MGTEPTITKYTVGFLFNEDQQLLALIQKKKPKWQCGMLNGIGGKIEPGENAAQAMTREFCEETGCDDFIDWKPFVTMSGTDWVVHFYKAFVPDIVLQMLKSPTNEKVVLVNVQNACAFDSNVIPNLRWLIPMALDNVMCSVVTL